MSYYVRSIETLVDELIDLGDEDRGFPAGPYLNPVSVTSRPKYWGYRTPEALEKSLKHVIECLKNSGLPWLETLRDPKVFADQTDPVAALPSGLAHEAAGNFAKAREAYREMHRRYSEMIAKFGEATVLRRSGKAYVFVTAKLGIDAERRRTFEDELNYHPDIEPLPQ